MLLSWKRKLFMDSNCDCDGFNKQINNENKRNLNLRPKDFRRGLELEASQ